MEINKQQNEKLQELYAVIYNARKFGINCSLELQEVHEIERSFIEQASRRVNDEFINSHLWEDVFMTETKKWDFFIYNGILCRLNEIYITGYNEGSDTYNYEAKIAGVFIEGDFCLEFNYNDRIRILKI